LETQYYRSIVRGRTDFLKVLYLVILMIFLSCDRSEITQNITLTVDFVLDETTLEFNGMVLVNAFDESQVLRDYGDNITGIDILGIDYYMTEFTGPGGQQFNTADLEVTGPDSTGTALIATLSDENLQSLLYEQKQMILLEEGVKRLEELIKDNPHEFRLIFSGFSNMTPDEFTLTIQIGLKMSAYPL
jgi:hypothetical protein